MDQQHKRYSSEGQNYRPSSAYDTRTYYEGEGHGSRDYMPAGRGEYDYRDAETHWDRYNSANYGHHTGNTRNQDRESYGNAPGNANDQYTRDDYRYSSGNREWHLNHRPAEDRHDRMQDRYNNEGRYQNQQADRSGQHRDMFEWVGSGVTRAWDSVTGHNRHPEHDRDYDYHRSYRNERRSYGRNEENERYYGSQHRRGYERGHNWADDTPNRQQQIGDRTWPEGNNQESDYHRAGRNFDRYRNS